MFLIAFSVFGLCFNALRSFFSFFWSLFLFPETIPSGACYMLMRLDDERLSPGWEVKRKCRCRDFKTIWAIHFFLSFAYKQTRRTNGVFFLVSVMEIIHLRQLLLGNESAINTITVIVLLRKKKVHFFQPIYLLSYLVLSPQSVHVHMLLREHLCVCMWK